MHLNSTCPSDGPNGGEGDAFPAGINMLKLPITLPALEAMMVGGAELF